MALREMSSKLRWLFVATAVWVMAEHAWSGTDHLNPAAKLSPQAELWCSQVDGHRLIVGASCVTTIKAEFARNDVGLHVRGRDEYIVSVFGEQVWYDASQKHIAPHGSSGSFLMNLFAFLKKDRDADWFALMAEIKGANKSYIHDLSRSSIFIAENDGQLVLYANDARGFYWNNHGEITVTVFRER